MQELNTIEIEQVGGQGLGTSIVGAIFGIAAAAVSAGYAFFKAPGLPPEPAASVPAAPAGPVTQS